MDDDAFAPLVAGTLPLEERHRALDFANSRLARLVFQFDRHHRENSSRVVFGLKPWAKGIVTHLVAIIFQWVSRRWYVCVNSSVANGKVPLTFTRVIARDTTSAERSL